jgi:uncharacterized protein YerC
LVHIAWGGEIPYKYEVNHINHIRWDNRIDNLEAITKYANLKDAFEFNDKKMLSKTEAYQVCELLIKRVPVKDIAKKFGVGIGAIQSMKAGRQWVDDVKQWGFDFSDLHKDSPSGLTPERVRDICDMIMEGKKISEISKLTGINYSTISSIKNGNNWSRVKCGKYQNLSEAKPSTGRSLNVHQVHEICQKLEKGGLPTPLAREYGVCQGTIIKIKRGIIWTHISSQYDFSKWRALRPGNKLTADNVHNICKELVYGNGNMPRKEIAEKYAISASTISDIAFGRIWVAVSSQYGLPLNIENNKSDN